MIAPPVKSLEGLISIDVKSVSNILIIWFRTLEFPLTKTMAEFFILISSLGYAYNKVPFLSSVLPSTMHLNSCQILKPHLYYSDYLQLTIIYVGSRFKIRNLCQRDVGCISKLGSMSDELLTLHVCLFYF